MGRWMVNCTALRLFFLVKPLLPELSQPSGWLWTGESRVPYKPQTWFSSRTRMLLAIFITDLSPSRGVPTLKAARCRPMDQMGNSPIELERSHPGRPQTTAARPAPTQLALDSSRQCGCRAAWGWDLGLAELKASVSSIVS